MTAALRSEWRKLVTTRMWWVLLVTMGVYMAFLGGVMGFTLTVPGATSTGMDGQATPELDPLAVATTVYSLAPALGYVFPVLLGAMSVTNEFRHKTLTPTFLVQPSRSLTLAAKLLAAVPMGAAYGVVGTVAATATGAGVLALRGHETFLAEPTVLRTLALSVLALTVWSAVGVGFGTAVPSQVGAVVVLLAFTQFVEPLLRMLLGSFDATAGVARWLPGAAGESITGASLYSSFGAGPLLAWWVGLLTLTGYGLVLAGIGRATTWRRDVT